MPIYATANGVQKELTSLSAMVDGVLREMGSVYSMVDGVLREVFASVKYAWQRYKVVTNETVYSYNSSTWTLNSKTSDYKKTIYIYDEEPTVDPATGKYTGKPTAYAYYNRTSTTTLGNAVKGKWVTFNVPGTAESVYKATGSVERLDYSDAYYQIHFYCDCYKVAGNRTMGNYINTVTDSNADAYPENGIHTDGYWYVYQGEYQPPAQLPAGYTRLGYIESTGAQFINTNVLGKSGLVVKMRASFNNLTGSQNLFGATEGGNRLFVQYEGALLYAYTNYYTTSASIVANTAYDFMAEFIAGKQVMYVDGKSVYTGNTTTVHSFSVPFYLLALNMGGTTYCQANAKLYSCQIEDGGVLVRDYVPCKNPSGEYGLYDLVTAEFYGNAGAGAFTGALPVPTISFAISGVQYEAVNGRTWAEWCESEYNVSGFYVHSSGNIMNSAGNKIVFREGTTTAVVQSETIEANGIYRAST